MGHLPPLSDGLISDTVMVDLTVSAGNVTQSKVRAVDPS